MIFTSVLYILLFHYLCNKKVCNYTVTPASLNQNWAELQGFIFCCFLKTHIILPKKLSKSVAFQTFPVKICLTASLPLVLLGHKLRGVRAQLLSQVQIFVTPWTIAHQAPLSVGFPRQEYWCGWLFPSAGDLPHLEVKAVSPELAGGFFATEPPGKPKFSGIQKLMQMGLLMWK